MKLSEKTLLVALLMAGFGLSACTAGTPYPSGYTAAPPPLTPPLAPPAEHAGHMQPLHGHGQEQGHEHHGQNIADIYAPIMAQMHKAMSDYAPTGDADADFVQGMIPHHQGALDMAYLVLEKGDDPYIRRLARDVILTQRREIAFMQYWLRTRGALPDSNISNVNVVE